MGSLVATTANRLAPSHRTDSKPQRLYAFGVTGCCDPRGCDDFFSRRFARRMAERYRKRGLDKTAARMVAFLEGRGRRERDRAGDRRRGR